MTQTDTATQGRRPRGWEAIVTKLNNAPDPVAFQKGILDLQCKIVAAEYGLLWAVDPQGNPRPVQAWPEKLANTPPEGPVMDVLKEAVVNGMKREQSHILKIEPEGAQSDTKPTAGPHVFVTVMRAGQRIAAISTVVADVRDPTVLQSTQPLRELAAGLFEVFAARQELNYHKQEAEHVRGAMGVLAVAQDARGFHGSCINLVNELARQLKCMRVSVGWIRGNNIRLKAMSDTEDLKRHAEGVAHIELAMAEALDQQQPIVHPAPDDAEPLLKEAIVHAHKQLTGQQTNRHALSVPLRVGDDWVGVITLERTDEPFDPSTIRHLQLIADVAAPHLHDRYNSDRWLIGHGWQSIKRGASYVVGPKHVVWKMVAILVICALAYGVFGTWDYRVSARFTLQAENRRVISAPFAGELEAVLHRKGDIVQEGDVLARLRTYDLKLERAEAQKELAVAQLERSKYLVDSSKRAEWKQAAAKIEQIQARLDLLDYRIDKATIVAPTSGILMSNHLEDKIGGVIETGEPMFEIAPPNDLTVVAQVSEADIDELRERYTQWQQKLGEVAAGAATTDEAEALRPTGHMSTRSRPEERFDFAVDRLIPVAVPVEGTNAFEVRARLIEPAWTPDATYDRGDTVMFNHRRYRAIARHTANPDAPPDQSGFWAPADWLRPGMEGVAKIDVGRERIAWILTRQIVDTVRLWLWI